MKRPRPYIPLVVRCRAAARQIKWGKDAVGGQAAAIDFLMLLHKGGYGKLLKRLLDELAGKLGCADLELHHRPALINRPFNKRTGKYTPDANDPAHLVYLPKADHGIETRVRGQHGQHSDLGLRRKLKRIEKNKAKRKHKSAHRGNKLSRQQSAKTLRSRPIQNANRWPAKGSQKLRSRLNYRNPTP